MSHKRKIDYKHWERGLSPQLLWKRNRNNTHKRDVLSMSLGMLFILLNTYITVYYTYLYLYILFIFIDYIINYYSIIYALKRIIVLYACIFHQKYSENRVYTRGNASYCSVFRPKIFNRLWLRLNTFFLNKSEQV